MYVKALVHINSLKSKDNACSKTNGAIAMVFVAKTEPCFQVPLLSISLTRWQIYPYLYFVPYIGRTIALYYSSQCFAHHWIDKFCFWCYNIDIALNFAPHWTYDNARDLLKNIHKSDANFTYTCYISRTVDKTQQIMNTCYKSSIDLETNSIKKQIRKQLGRNQVTT